MKNPEPHDPKLLTGPRSYFTDIDPRDPDYNPQTVLRKLKLQLLLKQTIVVAASSLFHKTGYELFHTDPGLAAALEQGVILPAVRKQFGAPTAFFDAKGEGYPTESRSFFLAHIKGYVPWDLHENSDWFKNHLYFNILDESSVLRRSLNIPDSVAKGLVNRLNCRIAEQPPDERFLRRDFVQEAVVELQPQVGSYITNFTNFLYRLSGAKVVRCEGHFPQANIVRLELVKGDRQLCDEAIFWDIYIEAVLSSLTRCAPLVLERLDRLTVLDVLKMRRSLFEGEFAQEYDRLISAAKQDVDIHDPEKLVLQQQEISRLADRLRTDFRKRIEFEMGLRALEARECALVEICSLLTSIAACGVLPVFFGALTLAKAAPTITAACNRELAQRMDERLEWVRSFINSRMGWSRNHRRSLLKGYEELLKYGSGM
jgi:hypothetical protein